MSGWDVFSVLFWLTKWSGQNDHELTEWSGQNDHESGVLATLSKATEQKRAPTAPIIVILIVVLHCTIKFVSACMALRDLLSW